MSRTAPEEDGRRVKAKVFHVAHLIHYSFSSTFILHI